MLDEDHSPRRRRSGGAAPPCTARRLARRWPSRCKVDGLPLSEAVTVIFHGRRDLGTLQTYVTWGSRGAGATVSASELLRVPCDLDLADAGDREEAERLYVEQATALRDALVGADTVLDVWREPLGELAGSGVAVDHSVELSVKLPAPRLLPTALVATESQLVVTPVCSARTLADGRPPMGIACAQQDLSRVYPLADDPERCVEDFLELAAEHALRWPSASITRRRRCSASWSSATPDGRRRTRRPVGYRAADAPPPLDHRRDRGRHRRLPGHRDAADPRLQRRRRRGRRHHRPRPGRGSRRHRAGHLPDHGLPRQRRLPRPRERQRRRAAPPGQGLDRRDQPLVDVWSRLATSAPLAWPGWRATRCPACSACASATPATWFRASRSSCWWSAGGSRATPTAPTHF